MNSENKRIVFICDYRVLHARRWIEYFFQNNYDLHIISTKACADIHQSDCYTCLEKSTHSQRSKLKYKILFHANKMLGQLPLVSILQEIYQDITYLLDYLKYRKIVKKLLQKLNPIIVHAMRIQPEGFIARYSLTETPFFLTTWGKDFVMYSNNRIFEKINKWVLEKVDSLFVDTIRDKYIADYLGIKPSSNISVLPVTGGLKLDNFLMVYDEHERKKLKKKLFSDGELTIFLSCRGYGRRYLLNELLLQSFSEVVRKKNNNLLLLIDGNKMTPGYYRLCKFIEKFNLSRYCRLVSYSHQELEEVMQCADYYISLSSTDGTPISMLEAMANGMIPIMSNLRCHQDWISHLGNGFLLDVSTVDQVTTGLSVALEFSQMSSLFAKRNFELLKEKADWYKIMPEMEKLYNIF